ncbi:hypothetical protein DPMN_005074 [Dreissena polymorpha]|uniref:Uncharacterized protein n=1 Tax=Dreissena polymorpha TaxID=45954 RepID=A0A9D4MRG8_DREPO|nr:hypothetical protein DPMN_005074 [Dreissena polymorpha]
MHETPCYVLSPENPVINISPRETIDDMVRRTEGVKITASKIIKHRVIVCFESTTTITTTTTTNDASAAADDDSDDDGGGGDDDDQIYNNRVIINIPNVSEIHADILNFL